MNYYPKFAELLREHLHKRDRSPAWLARELRKSTSTVTRWLNDGTRPDSPETIIRIADILSIHEPNKRQALLGAARYGYVEGEKKDMGNDSSHSQPKPGNASVHQVGDATKANEEPGEIVFANDGNVEITGDMLSGHATKTTFTAPNYGPVHTGSGHLIIQDEFTTLKQQLSNPQNHADTRMNAARKLGESLDIRAVSTLIVSLANEVDPTVRYEIAVALGQIGGSKAIEALIEAAKQETEFFARMGIIDGLRAANYPNDLPPLIVQDGSK